MSDDESKKIYSHSKVCSTIKITHLSNCLSTIHSVTSSSNIPRGNFVDGKITEEVDLIAGNDSRRYVDSGLNLEGHCKKYSCRAYGQSTLSIFMWGFRQNGNQKDGTFDFFWDSHLCKCPLCGEQMQPVSCGFLRTQWKMSGYRITNSNKAPEYVPGEWKSTNGNKYERFVDSSQIVPWDKLKIEVRSR